MPYGPVCVGPGLKPHCWFSHEAAHIIISADLKVTMVDDPVYGPYDRLPDNADDTQCTLTVTGQKCPLAGINLNSSHSHPK